MFEGLRPSGYQETSFEDAYQYLDNKGFQEAKERSVAEMYAYIEEMADQKGLKIEPFHDAYAFAHPGEYVRRADVDDVLNLVFRGENVKLEPHFEDAANAAIASADGIQVALSEGLSKDSVVGVFGFRSEDTKITKVRIPNHQRNMSKRNAAIRSITGTVHPEDVTFSFFRFPAKEFPEKNMTEWEIEQLDDDKLTFVYRALKKKEKEDYN